MLEGLRNGELLYCLDIKDASKKRVVDIEANEKGTSKRSAALKSTRRLQKRTAIVNPLPVRKLQKAKSESSSEIEVPIPATSRQASQAGEHRSPSNKRVSKSGERNPDEAISPKRSPKKKLEIKCEHKHWLNFCS